MLDRIGKEAEGQTNREVYFTNIIRLLEMHRFDALTHHEPSGVLEVRPMAAQQLGRDDDPAIEIERALTVARQAVDPKAQKDELLLRIQTNLATISEKGTASAEDLAITRRFLEEFIRELTAE